MKWAKRAGSWCQGMLLITSFLITYSSAPCLNKMDTQLTTTHDQTAILPTDLATLLTAWLDELDASADTKRAYRLGGCLVLVFPTA